MMSSSPTIDVERLLAPISEEHPTGEALSIGDAEGPFLKIKDAWDEGRKLLREQIDKEQSGGIDSAGQAWRTIPDPDWDTIIDLSVEVLANSTKEFRVASWLTEALLRKYHLPGLRDGLELCMGLCERYWDNIHPAPNDEDGHGVTVGAFASLVSNATFGALLATPVVVGQKPNEREPRSYSAQDFLHAKELETLEDTEERERRLEDGQIEMIEFQAVAALTPPEIHRENLDTIDQCLAKLNEIGEFLRENCRDDEYDESTAPGVSSFREQMESLRRTIGEFAGTVEEEEETTNDSDGGTGEPGVGRSQEMTRETAFQSIERIAQFFERTEPHSPVYFALRQAVRWGRMPLPDLLRELIEDGSTMEALRKQIGLPQQPEEGY